MSDAFKNLCDLLDKTAYETAYAAPLGSREAEERVKTLYREGRFVEAQAVIEAALKAAPEAQQKGRDEQ